MLKWAPFKRSASVAEDSAAGAPAQTVRLSREQIIRLGQSGRPWEFVPIARQAILQAPDDAQLRVLLAANFARLRLRTLALETLEALGEAHQDDPNVRALQTLMAQLPDDAISVGARAARLRANLDTLARRGVDLWPHAEAWQRHTANERWFAAADGNVVRCNADGPVRIADDFTWARNLDIGVRLERAAGGELVSPDDAPWFVVQGASPPWLLQRILSGLPRTLDGYWPRVYLVHADVGACLDGLAHADLRDELAQSRLHVFVGHDALKRLRDDLVSRRNARLAAVSASTPDLDPALVREGEAIILEAQAAQREACAAARARVEAHYAALDAGAWSRRYSEGLAPGSTSPLRVLIPTYRYSTFIRHSSADLASALQRLGCRVQLLMEPDDSSKLSAASYELAADEFRPDLILRINYPRSMIGWFPEGVPFVTWIQDAMPHLFREQVGAAHTDRDFVVGHLYPELFTQFGYPRSRTLDEPVSASAEKFHNGPVSDELRARLTCDIAYVSHQSETPEDLHRRLWAQAQTEPGLSHVFDILRPMVEAAARGAMERLPVVALTDASKQALRAATGSEPDSRLVTRLTKQYAEPMGERIVRHAALEWAATAARQRGWTLKIFGKGWERHPTLRRFAAGELAHGEELRAAYACAKVHLHMSLRTNLHQRVLECVLSGGTPLCLATRADYQAFKDAALRTVIGAGIEPTTTNFENGALGYDPASHPALAALDRVAHALKARSGSTVWVSPARRDVIVRERLEPGSPHAIALLGDSCSCFFTGEDDFRQRLEQLLGDDRARAHAVDGARQRVLEHATVEGLAQRLLALVGRELETPTR